MPLIRSKSQHAFDKNLKHEMAEGKPQKQSLAIAYSVQKRAHKMAKGGKLHGHKPELEKMAAMAHYKKMAEGGIINLADKMEAVPMHNAHMLQEDMAYPHRQLFMKLAEGGLLDSPTHTKIMRAIQRHVDAGYPLPQIDSGSSTEDEAVKSSPHMQMLHHKAILDSLYKGGLLDNRDHSKLTHAVRKYAALQVAEKEGPEHKKHHSLDSYKGKDVEMKMSDGGSVLDYPVPAKKHPEMSKEYMSPEYIYVMADGGMLDDDMDADMDMQEDKQMAKSLADHIMHKRRRAAKMHKMMKKMAEGGEVEPAYGEDHDEYTQESILPYRQSEALDEEYGDDEDLYTPMESGDSVADTDVDKTDEDLVSKIRRKMKKSR